MGCAKRQMEQEQDALRVATDIAVRAGVLEVCPYCDSTVYQTEEPIEIAYKLGNSEFSSGELDFFETRREMTDAIKDAVDENCGECCFHCYDKINGDD